MSASTLTSHGRLSRLTPYWRVGCRARSAAAERAWHAVVPLAKYRQPPVWTVAVLLLGVVPYFGFVVWMLGRVQDVATIDLQWRMWLGGLWILVSPGLIVAWERRFLRLHSVLVGAAEAEGWNVDRLVGVDRVFGRLWWPTTLATGGATVVGYLTGLEFLRSAIGAAGPASPYFWVGLVVTAMMGASFGVGMWGVAKTLVYAWVALDSELVWEPFRPRQPDSFEELSSFTYWTGLLYSLGSVLLPATLAIIGRLPPPGLLIGFMFAGCLVFGGAAVFVLPSVWMSRVAGDLNVAALDRYTNVLTQLSAMALAPPNPDGRSRVTVDFAQLSDHVTAVTSLRSLVAAEQTAPSASWVGARILTIFIVPIVIGVIQAITGIG